MIDLEQVDKILEAEKAAAEIADRNVLIEVERVRRYLDALEKSVRDGQRVPSSASGETFFSSGARELTRALNWRGEAYRVVALLNGLRSRAEKEV